MCSLEKNNTKHIVLKYTLCISSGNGADLGTYSLLWLTGNCVVQRVIGSVCSQTCEVLCTISTSTEDKHLRVRIGGPNCNYLFLHVSTTFMIH